MLSIVKTMQLDGLDGYLVEVQTDVTGGLPSFDIVGLPDASIKEARERIKTAIRNTGIDLMSRKFLINLAPASTKKEGTSMDLPMAIGILLATGKITTKIDLTKTVFIGELSLNGKINSVNGILPMCIDALKMGIERAVIPKANAKEARIVKGLEIIAIKNLQEIIEMLNGKKKFKKEEFVNIENLLNKKNKYNVDFSEVKGQENIKRALEIAAAGRS